MAWQPLAQRLNTLPLVIAGPILRRVEKNTVSVWIALKEGRDLILTVLDESGAIVITGQRHTVALGNNLHIAVITASLPPPSLGLSANTVYSYNVTGQGVDIIAGAPVSYLDSGFLYPTFSLPPTSISDLRIVHASCRKMQAEGEDAFSALENMIHIEAATPSTYAQKRPHHLFLTGDQIYADDVSSLQLFLIRDAMQALVGLNETLPGLSNDDISLGIDCRGSLMGYETGFKFPFDDQYVPVNHLAFLGEFYCMYLFMWSPVLWPHNYTDYPTYEDLYQTYEDLMGYLPPQTKPFTSRAEFDELVLTASVFQQSLPAIRLALANVPTYMICDDHEITDDWFLNLKWVEDVLSNDLGTRIVQNGLTAFALFQAWGNTPEKFQGSEPGKKLLDIIPYWSNYEASDVVTMVGNTHVNTTYKQSMYNLLGLPDLQLTIINERLIPAGTEYLTYNYHIDWETHEVFVLDTRNERAFPGGRKDFPALISPQGLARQMPAFSPTAEIILLIIATPISGIPNIEDSLKSIAGVDKYYADAEAYSFQEYGIQSLYAAIATNATAVNSASPTRVVVLSGDVHYGFSNRVEFWGTKLYGTLDYQAPMATTAHFILAQLCASALKNEKKKTSKLFGKTGTNRAHEDGYTLDELSRPTVVMGWANPFSGSRTVGTKYMTLYPYPIPFEITTDRYVFNLAEMRIEGEVPATLIEQPDWIYRVDYQVALPGTVRPGGQTVLTVLDPSAGSALQSYLDASSNAQTYKRHDGYGREAVGKNNLGEVRFSWGTFEEEKIVKHQIWWRLDSNVSGNTIALPPYPLSEFEILLGEENSKYPKPNPTI